MARTAPHNFVYHSGPLLKKIKRVATDAQTWKAGQPYTIAAAGTVTLVATDGVNVKGIFAEDQDTATSTTTVWCLEIQDASTKFIAYSSTDDADSAVTSANEGNDYGVHTANGISTVNTGEASNVCFLVESAYHNLETGKAAAADSPGRVVGRFLASVVDAGGA